MVRGSIFPQPPIALVGIVLKAIRGIRAIVYGVAGHDVLEAVFEPSGTPLCLFRTTIWHDDIPPTA
jgi:hypothetical protein